MQSFVKKKPSRNCKTTLSFTEIGKSWLGRITNMYFNSIRENKIRENKIRAKISELTLFLKLFDTLIMHILTYSSVIYISDFKIDLLDNSYQFEKSILDIANIYLM